MKTLLKTRVSGTLGKKNTDLLDPDRTFFYFTLCSWIIRMILNLFLPHDMLSEYFRFGSTLFLSTFFTVTFILVCLIKKVDWYGKQKKDVIPAIRKWSKERVSTRILFFPFLFNFDPFLLFIYLKNGFTNVLWQLFSCIMLILSLGLNSYYWTIIGSIKTEVGILPVLALLAIFVVIYLRLKKWAKNYL